MKFKSFETLKDFVCSLSDDEMKAFSEKYNVVSSKENDGSYETVPAGTAKATYTVCAKLSSKPVGLDLALFPGSTTPDCHWCGTKVIRSPSSPQDSKPICSDCFEDRNFDNTVVIKE